MPKQNEDNNHNASNEKDTPIIALSDIFSVDGEKLCVESKEIGSQLFYTII